MKDKIIIVEGPQGAGKTTFTNYLREKMSATDLYRLTGIKDKEETGLNKIRTKYNKLLEYMANCKDVNLLFDRNFFSEEVYGRLGYKKYSFTEVYEELLAKLDKLDFDIYLIVLYLEDTSEYEKRLGGRVKHQYQKFDIKSSIEQQEAYLKLSEEVKKKAKNIKVIKYNAGNNENYEANIDKELGFLFIE